MPDSWIRQPPEGAITDPGFFPFFQDSMEFEEFVPLFGEWYAEGHDTACLVGIRSDESLNRYRTIASNSKVKRDGRQWTTLVSPNVTNVYPIYDWRTEDIWTWHARNPDAEHNRLYDLMYKAGVPLGHQRICQPYGDDQRRGLWLFHIIEPETWAPRRRPRQRRQRRRPVRPGVGQHQRLPEDHQARGSHLAVVLRSAASVDAAADGGALPEQDPAAHEVVAGTRVPRHPG